MGSSVLGPRHQLDERELVLQMQKLDLRDSGAQGSIAHEWQGHDLNPGLSDVQTTP